MVRILDGNHHPPDRSTQCGTSLAQFGLVVQRQFAQYSFPLRSERQEDFTTVILALLSLNISVGGKTVHQFYCAVVLELKTLCQFRNPRARSAWKALQSQHQLMLVRFEAYSPSRNLTEVEKASDMVPQIG
jgi:hypothetical protein